MWLELGSWVLGVGVALVMADTWQLVVALAIELGIPGILLMGYLSHKWSVKVERL